MRIAFVDIETSSLRALMGHVHCVSFLEWDKDHLNEPYTMALSDKKYKGKSNIDDSKLVAAVREELKKYHMIVTWNGKLFDVPFLNARLSKAGLIKNSTDRIQPQFHLDAMYMAGGSAMRIGSKKLDNVAKFYKLGEQKTSIDWDIWQEVNAGNTEMMKIIIEHCEADVKTLRDAYELTLPFVANIHR